VTLAKLHCNEISSEQLVSTVTGTRAELQDADTRLASATQQLDTSRQHCQQLLKQRQDADDILRQQVNTGLFTQFHFFYTRSQAVAKIADRTASQHLWGHVMSSVT